MSQTAAAEAKNVPFGTRDKLAYAAGDFGCNMSFALKSYLTVYWTQYMGVDSVLLAGLLIVVQVWDAINDPLIGTIVDADHHQYKRNKFLAYISVGSIGLLFAGALCFLPFPNAPTMVKNILFVAGYMIWDAFYTVANVPYGSMLSLISDDPAERAQLSTWRSVGSMAGSIGTAIIVPMVIYDASSNLRGGLMFWMALIMGVIGLICFRFMVNNTVVRVNLPVTVKEDTPKFNVFHAMKNFLQNRAAVGATLAPFGMFIAMYGASTASTVMFQAYFNAAQISGIVSMLGYIGIFLYMPFINKIVLRFGKKEATVAGCCISVLAYVLMLVLPITPDTKGLMLFIVCQLINSLGSGIGTCLAWSLMADATDYGEWKFGVREEGTTYSLHSFFRKLGQSIGPSLGLLLATWLGYDAALGAAQPIEVATTMRYLVAFMYLLSAIIQLVAYGLVYNLDKKTLASMQSDLAERRAVAAAAAEEA